MKRTLTLIYLLSLCIISFAQYGTVLSYQKISEDSGGFTGLLDPTDQMGIGVASLGDIDSDGVEDIGFGVYQDDDGATNAGAIYICLMNSNGTVKSTHKISNGNGGFSGSLPTSSGFGVSLAGIGDQDQDGVPDLAVGAYQTDGTGAIWIFLMNANATVKSHLKINNGLGGFPVSTLTSGDNFGIDVYPLGDLDGDGWGDIVVGAAGDDDGGSSRGAAYILFLDSLAQVKNLQKISDTQGGFTGVLANSDVFGISVASVADMDGDGNRELIAGTLIDDGGTNKGAVFVCFLNSNGTVKSEQRISSIAGGFTGVLDAGDYFGYDCNEVGDLDGDGISDIMVGAYSDDDGLSGGGAVWTLFLNANGTVKSHQKISDTAGNFSGKLEMDDGFGIALCGVRDLNNDGVWEILAGTWQDDDGGSNQGAGYLLFVDGVAACQADAAFSSSSLSVCAGGAVTFTADNANQTLYKWKENGSTVSNDTMVTRTFTTPGNYQIQLIVGDTNCSDTMAFSLLVMAGPTPDAGNDNTICEGDSATLSGSFIIGNSMGPWAVLWNTGDTILTPNVAPASSSWYYLTVSDGMGCANTDSVLMTVIPIPMVSISIPDTLFCFGPDPAATLTGTPSGGVFSGPGVSGASFDPDSAGVGIHTLVYNYTIGPGCSASDSLTVQVSVCQGLANRAEKLNWKVYPNPSNGNFFVEWDHRSLNELVLLDLAGKVIFTQNFPLARYAGKIGIELGQVASGMYLLRVKFAGEWVNHRLRIE